MKCFDEPGRVFSLSFAIRKSHFKYLHIFRKTDFIRAPYFWIAQTITRFLLFCYYSTREIKPNQTDIGRKITKKPSAITSSVYNRTTTSGQTSSSTTPNSLISNGKRPSDSLERGPSSGDGQQLSQLQSSMSHLTSQQQISATSSHSYNITSSQDHHHDPYQHHNNSALNGVVGDDVDHQRTTSSMGNLSRNSGQQNHRNPDIMKKPIKWVSMTHFLPCHVTYEFLCARFNRERLIHLLALRPFKKLELYDRLNRGT